MNNLVFKIYCFLLTVDFSMNKEKSVWKECHGNTASHEFKLYSNTSSDYAVNTILYSFGLYGTLAKFISKKIGDHLELYEFKDGRCLEVGLPGEEDDEDEDTLESD